MTTNVRRIHLDTDLGGDPDDVCALAMLLGSPDVDLVGITTVLDRDGRRAGYTQYVLELVGRGNLPVVAGAVASLTTGLIADPEIADRRFWPENLPLRPAAPGDALNALAVSIASGAEIVAIGPVTNLAMLEIAQPGILKNVTVTAMGGWIDPPRQGLPEWGPEMDWNVQWDTRAMAIVAGSARLKLATLTGTLMAHLRKRDVPRLRASGPLGDLIARQSEAHAELNDFPTLGRRHAGLPDDLLNMHYDPAACALALGWNCLTTESCNLRVVLDGETLRFERDDAGTATVFLTDVESDAFADRWLGSLELAQTGFPK